jgi:hypothetical protein
MNVEDVLVQYCTKTQGSSTYLKEKKLIKIILALGVA